MNSTTLKKVLLTGTAIVAVSAFASTAAYAQNISSVLTGTPDALTGGGANVTNTVRDGAAEFGAIDIQGGESVGTITTGLNDANANDNLTIRIYDGGGGGSTLTVGNVTIVQDTTPADTDTLTFEIGDGPAGGGTTDSVVVDFNGNVNAGAGGVIDITFADNGSADDVIFSGATVNLGATGLAEFSNAADSITFDRAGTQTFTGIIDADGDGEGVVNVINESNGGVIFNGAVGGTSNSLAQIFVGDGAGAGGTATFNSTVDSDLIDVTAADTGDGADAVATFNDAVVSGSVTLTSGDTAAEAATATFNGDVTATDFTLDEDAGALGVATLNFAGDAAQAIAGTVDASTDGQGIVNITNTTGTGVTFADTFGASGDLDVVNVGTSSSAGIAVFEDTVDVDNFNVNARNGTNSTATFESDFDADDVTLNDVGSGNAVLIFAGSGAAIDAPIDGAAAGEGTITIIDDTGAVFADVVGGAARLEAINIGDGTSEGLAVFDLAVSATGINVTAINGTDSEVVFSGDVTTTGTTGLKLDDDTNVALVTFDGGAAQTVAGVVTAASDGEGDIEIENSNATGVTFSGAVGTALAKIGLINVGNGNAGGDAVFSSNVFATALNVDSQTAVSTVDFNGNATIDTLTVTDGALGGGAANSANFAMNFTGDLVLDAQDAGTVNTVTFDGAGAQLFTGTIDVSDATGANNVSINGTAANVTFTGDIGTSNALTDFDIAAGNFATFSDGLDAVNTITVDSVAFDNNGGLVLNDFLAFGAGTTADLAATGGATLALGSSFAANDVIITNGGDLDIGAALTITVNPLFKTGFIDLFDTDGAGNAQANFVANVTIADTALVTYTTNANVATGRITATTRTAAQAATAIGVSQSNAAKLLAVSDTTDAVVQAALAAATAVATPGTPLAAETLAANNAAEQTSSDTQAVGAGFGDAAAGSVRAATGSINTRLASLRDGGSAGVAAGEAYTNGSFWLRGTYSDIDQDEKDGVAGYTADAYSVTAGVDTEVAEDTILGVAVSYGSADIDGDSAANSTTEVDSYQVALYGEYNPGNYYVSGNVGYGQNDVDVTSTVLGLGVSTGDFSTGMYNAAVETGYNYKFGETARFIPSVGLEYVHIEGESYVLSSGLGSVTDTIEDKDILIGKVGGRIENTYAIEGGTLFPEVHANLLYDFAGDESESSRTFAGAVTINDTAPDVEEFGINLGTGIAYASEDGMTEVSAGYDAEIKSDFLAHTGQVKVKFKF